MEDAATAEISRSQLWHWAYHGASTVDGTKITAAYIDKILNEETIECKKTGLDAKRVDLSARYLKDQIRAKALSDFLTSDLMYVPPPLRAALTGTGPTSTSTPAPLSYELLSCVHFEMNRSLYLTIL